MLGRKVSFFGIISNLNIGLSQIGYQFGDSINKTFVIFTFFLVIIFVFGWQNFLHLFVVDEKVSGENLD